MDPATSFLWQGRLCSDTDLGIKIRELPVSIIRGLALRADPDRILDAADSIGGRLLKGDCPQLIEDLQQAGLSETDTRASLLEVGQILLRSCLEPKVRRELGEDRSFRLRRIDYASDVFEGWLPLGTVLHIAPGNTPSSGCLSVIEALLCGNVNLLKDTPRNGMFSLRLLEMIGDACPEIRPLLYGFHISSSDQQIMQPLYDVADAVAVWGGDSALAAVRQAVPPGVRLVEWGHRISFGYFSLSALDDTTLLESLAHDICRMEQQACASPQVLYVDTEDFTVVKQAAAALGRHLDRVSLLHLPIEPTIHEQAEITTATLMTRLQQPYGDAEVVEDHKHRWRLLVENHCELKASPLYRTLWVKPLPRRQMVETLLPYRRWLQTVSLGCSRDELAGLTTQLFQAGATRIVRPGQVFASYPGEPHDGVRALPRYCKRVDIQGLGDQLPGIAEIDELLPCAARPLANDLPVTGKDYFFDVVPPANSQLFVKSGGSSDKPKLSGYTWHDYSAEMQAAADGLFAAGLNVRHDRCMNLFYAGHLYGGFLSIFTILEKLGAIQFPMSAVDDLDFIAKIIIEQRVNTLCGMPNYLIRLFREQEEVLKDYGGVKKIFYAGEMFNPGQIASIQDTFGVESIQSMVYGSNDIGPMGFPCPYCHDGVHHLMTDAQQLEIFSLDSDEPVAPGEVGRLLFTPRLREGQRITRYEIGDLGCWVDGDCPCGRTAPRFQLMGRYGDIFKAGTTFLNYRAISRCLSEHLNYSGLLQLQLDYVGGRERLAVHLDRSGRVDPVRAKEILSSSYSDLREVTVDDSLVDLVVKTIADSEFQRTANSDKLIAIVDNRVPEEHSDE